MNVTSDDLGTCQCPRDAQGKPSDISYVAPRAEREIRDGNNRIVAYVCDACTRPCSLWCRACDMFVPNIDRHVGESPACKDELAYRMAHMPRPSMRVTKAALKLTGTLFPEEVLDPGKRTGAVHK